MTNTHFRVLMVGSAERSGGGVASVIRTMKQMPLWKNFHCGWLGTQIQRGYTVKIGYALKAYGIALFSLWRYDIIHFHTVPDRIGLLIQMPVFLLARLLRKKIILQIHMGNQLSKHTNNKLFLWHLRHADLIVLLAPKWKILFEKWYPTITIPTTMVYNAVENVKEVKHDEKEKLIVMAAYFNDNKAPDVLLRAWKSIHMRFPDWRIEMLGNGEVERFRKMSEEMGLHDSVSFSGYVTGEQKETVFRKASILCLCSYEEGFPMVAIEAWAYGICLVTTPVGGLPDVLELGRNALTFVFGDSDALAKCLEQLMGSEEQRQAMANYSRHFVYEHFSMDIINEKWQNIYNKLLTGK